MKEIVILSGKGGTGKTSITGALAAIAEEKIILADADVDASNMHLITKKEKINSVEYKNGFTAEVNVDKCTGCRVCELECVFDAIKVVGGKAVVDDMFCEGCKLCSRLCPTKAIQMKEMRVGEITTYSTRFKNILISAMMDAKRERSGKLVSEVKRMARAEADKRSADYILLDGPPGIGCPAIASLGGVNYAVLVIEPTISGFHDMKRIYALIKYFRIKTGMIINKSDINECVAGQIREYAKEIKSVLLGEIKYDEIFIESVNNNKTVVELSDNLRKDIMEIWKKIKEEAK
ncbi:MAG: 4Fe-4S binding protein [bacterium]